MKFRRLGMMLDCSRNAVMSVQSIKRWIDVVSDMGYNTVLLYIEDTYEVDNQPYFGYLRGKYSQKELRERYAERIVSRLFGMYKPLLFKGNDIRAQKLTEGRI